MMFYPTQNNDLSAPLGREHVKQRTQAGRQLSYIEGWHAIAEANRIFGFSEWDRELKDIRQLGEAREVDGKWRVAYMATVRIRVVTRNGPESHVTRDGTGYGSGIDRDLGSAHESAIKEAETDAMKRALMTFGNPFGLALYDKEQREVADAPKPPVPPIADTLPPLNDASESQAIAIEMIVTALVAHKTYNSLASWWKANQANIKAALPSDYYEAEIVERQIKPRLAKYWDAK